MSVLNKILLFGVLALVANSFRADESLSKNDLDSMVAKIEAVLDTLQASPETAPEKIVLGALFVKANLQWTIRDLQHVLDSNDLFLEKLNSLITKCDVLVNGFSSAKENGTEWATILAVFANNGLWNNSAQDFRVGTLNATTEVNLNFTSCPAVVEYLYNGHLNDSDVCLEELVEGCLPTDKCLMEEAENSDYSGYGATDRLLYLMVAKRMGCYGEILPEFTYIDSIEEDICQKMMSDAEAMERENFPTAVRNLFLTQIAFCGLEGFTEFAKTTWRKRLLEWQDEEGCLGFTEEENATADQCFEELEPSNTTTEVAVSSEEIDNEPTCESCMTGASISALAFHLRYTSKFDVYSNATTAVAK